MWFKTKAQDTLTAATALAGRSTPMPITQRHHVLGTALQPPFSANLEQAVFALGCFWGAEKAFWKLAGVHSTSVGYCAGFTPNPTYEEVCSGETGHTEAVLVVFDPAQIGYAQLATTFWESHDPTQGMQQGNDVGTQYRSASFWFNDAQRGQLLATQQRYQQALTAAGRGAITTETGPAPTFYWAEAYHQQYLSKNPGGYCGLGGTGVACPVPSLRS